MATPIAIAVVKHEGRFLVGQRPASVPLAGLWEFPGGRIESGETPEAAAVRECLEETGVAVQPLFRYLEHVQSYDHDCVQLYFIGCSPQASQIDSPHLPFRWVDREVLNQLRFPEGNRAILEVLTAETASRIP